MTDRDHIPGAASIIMQEARSLELLAQGLGQSFNLAVEAILGTRGRVAVTGMGKSGHIARKVAATLASTGTPAFFIHPAEAGHGDLGMLAPGQDILMAFSNSGQTAELDVVLQFCARSGIRIIGVTKDPESLLGRNSDIVFVLPCLSEACPLGCAPTTSTTMMLALGDALALSLLSARGFTVEDFRQYHPGGKLGSRLASVGDLMHSGQDMPLASPGDRMGQALFVMTSKRLGCLGIVDGDGKLAGIITDGDLRRHMGPSLMEASCSDIMTRDPISFDRGTMAAKALATMRARGITNAFVLDPGGVPLGAVHIHDLLAAGVT
ncbi:MAG: KpsF/GutQ family sugar-phosphate isomerase [Deltaproteobacteria bacterium]|jgi:arabinose-5-phosphate isomerase|nr:KpsF/GutQ family sugar-phosphate isomerase [Deltaproteobacteria bacterium]